MKHIRNYLLLLLFLLNFNSNYSQNVIIIRGINNQQKTTIDLDTLPTSNYSFHFLLPSIGRKSIFQMLDSLEPQLKPQDFVTVIFDAKDVNNIFEDVKKRVESFPCIGRVIFEEKNLGSWGHGIRNKYAQLEGDFIMHCDDDDIYLPNALSAVRKICVDPTKLYIFRVNYHGRIWWKRPRIRIYNVTTHCGVVPTTYNGLGTWGPKRGGDAVFYKEVSGKINPADTIFVDFVIYKA